MPNSAAYVGSEDTDAVNRLGSAGNPDTSTPSPMINMRSAGLNKDIVNSLKKKKRFYYYSLNFEVRFEHDDDIVYFAFSQPYPYSQVMAEILEKEETLKPAATGEVQLVPRKVIGQNIKPASKTELPTYERQNTNP